MKAIQVISVLSLIIFSLLKYELIDGPFSSSVTHYLFNASMLLIGFSILFPIFSAIKLKNLTPHKSEELRNILREVDPGSQVEVYTSKNLINNSSAVLFQKNKQIILLGEELFAALDREQLKFILAHEFYHIKKKHLLKNIFSIILVLTGVPIILLTTAPPLILYINLIPTLIISVLIYITSLFLHFYLSQNRELEADNFAKVIVGRIKAEETLNILSNRNLVPEKSYNIFQTHPSVRKRIERLATVKS